MISCLIIALILVNVFMIIRRENNKVIALVSLICIWMIMGLNTYTDDYPGYMRLYDSQTIGLTMEPGFTLLTDISYRLGLSYAQFLAIFMVGALIIGAVAVMKVTNNYHVVICAFSLTALYLNVDEIRQFMAYILYALALAFLTDEKRGKLKYGITICLASTIQISSIVLLPFPFIFSVFKDHAKVIKRYLIVIALFCVVVFLNGNRIPFLYELASLILPEDKLVYFTTHTNWGFLVFFLANILNMMVAYYGVNEVEKHALFYSEKERQYASNLFKSIAYLSFAMPLCMTNSEFLRFFRFSVIPCIIMIAITFNRPNNIAVDTKKKEKMVFKRTEFVLLLYILVYQLCMQHWRIVQQVLENNMLNN